MEDTPQDNQASPQPPGRRRRLRGCGITLAIILVAALLLWWVVSRNLGVVLASVVREQAGAAINGRLEFDRLTVDLAGRAVLTNAAVYGEGGTEPLITCPRTVIAFDLLNFIGPNRGRRAVTVTLHQPQLTLVRELDGSFNLTRLAKDTAQDGEPIGLALHLRGAGIDFTDWCLLDQSYPRLTPTGGMVGDLLADLGYDLLGPPEMRPHRELLSLSGNVVLNPQRNEMTLDLDLEREALGGKLTAKGSAALDGTRFDLRGNLRNLDFSSCAAYVQAVFPKLALAAATTKATAGTVAANPEPPFLTGRLVAGSLRLSKDKDTPVALTVDVELADTSLQAGDLPVLLCNKLTLDYNSVSGRLLAGIDVTGGGLRLTGKPQVNLEQEQLSGKLKLECADPAALAAYLGQPGLELTGGFSAQLTLAGGPTDPQVTAVLSSDKLKYRQLSLGQLSGTVAYGGKRIVLDAVKFTKGDLPLTATGSIDTDSQDGSLELSAGPLALATALELAAKLAPSAEIPELAVGGSFSVTAAVTLAAGNPNATLHLWSDRLTVNDQQLDKLDIRSTLNAPNLTIDAAEAVLVTQAVNLGGFTSTGPLQVKLRAGGSVSTLPGQELASVAIIGECETQNLAPNQARASFKIIGPTNDPELRLQVKTVQATYPLLVSASGHYRQGFAPVTASLTWQETTAEFTGQVDFAGQQMKGTLSADKVNLRRFSGDKNISGTLSVAAELGGTFTRPSVTGSVAVPLLSYATPARTMTFVDAAANFKLVDGSRVSVTDGRFVFDGNHFSIGGELGGKSSNLAVRCHEFNLFSAMAMTGPPPASGTKQAYLSPELEIQSSGPLTINLTGELTDPTGTIEYTSGAGSVKGHAFSSAELRGSFSKSAAKLERFEIKSPEGRISADGRFEFNPLRYSCTTTVEEFDVAVLSSLAGDPATAGLTGKLNGRLHLAGTEQGYSLDGNLRLANGSFQGVAVSIASAEFQTAGSSITIRNGNVVAEGTMLTAYGSFDPASDNLLASTTLNVDATSLDLALLQPLLGDMVTHLSGRLAGKLSLTPGSGRYPSATLSAHSTSSIRFENVEFDSLKVAAAIAQDKLSLTRCELKSGESTLSASGQLDLGNLQQGRAVPLDLTLNCNALNLGDLKPLLPESGQVQLPSGVVTCNNLRLTGTSAKPSANGTVDFDLTGLPEQFNMLDRAKGRLAFTGVDMQLINVQLTPAGTVNSARIITVSADIHRDGSLIKVMNGKIQAEGTTLTASGSFNPTADDPLAGANLTVDAASLDLALLEPFLDGMVSTISGRVSCKLSLTPGPGRYPNASLSAYSTQRIKVDDSEFDSIKVTASATKDKLNVTQCELVNGQSTLSASGQLDLGSLREGRTVPLDLTLNTNELNLGDIKQLLPIAQQAMLPSGVVTCRNIRLTGNTKSPLISGSITFDLSDMPAEFDMLARAIGSISFTDNDFEINNVQLTPASASSGVSGSAVVSGSGRFSLLPFSLVEGAVSVDLAPGGSFLLVDTTESRSEMLSTLNFTGRIGGNLLLTGGKDRHGDQRMQISGTIVINQTGEVSRITVYQKETGELGSAPAPFIFSPQLTIKMEAGTSLYYKPMDLSGKFVGDLRTELFTQNIALTGVPGISNPADSEAFRINGTIQIPSGSVKVYRHIVRLEGEGTQLRFMGIPGEIMPVFDGTGTLTLRNVLATPSATGGASSNGRSSGSGNRDLKILFTFTQFKMDMGEEETSIASAPGGMNSMSGSTPGLRITSEPPLPENQIVAYLMGGAQDVISGQTGLGDFAQGELVAYGTSFISREIEEMFNLAAFQFGGIGNDNNPFYVDMEKRITPDFSVTYYRDYFSDSTQNEEFGVKYRLMEQHQGKRYQNLELEVNFLDNAFSGSGGEFMFTWTTSF